MPLTLSHPAAVLPLRRLGLPATATVVGSMVPDVPLFLGSQRGNHKQTAASVMTTSTVTTPAELCEKT